VYGLKKSRAKPLNKSQSNQPTRRQWELLEQALPMLRSYIARYVRNGEAVSDLLQEVSLRILLCPGPDDDERFLAWSRGVARHVIWGERRRSRLFANHVDGASKDLDLRGPSDPESQVNVRRSLARFSVAVDRDSFELLVRHYVFEETYAELSYELAQSPAALRMRLMRIRSQLRPGDPS
jgi:RNA polymerase sigma factor (sigma-70 family)